MISKRKYFRAYLIGIVMLLILIWHVISTQRDYMNYVYKLTEKNAILQNRERKAFLPVVLFSILKGLGVYETNYERIAIDLNLMAPEGSAVRPRVFGYAVYLYYSDYEIDSIQRIQGERHRFPRTLMPHDNDSIEF